MSKYIAKNYTLELGNNVIDLPRLETIITNTTVGLNFAYKDGEEKPVFRAFLTYSNGKVFLYYDSERYEIERNLVFIISGRESYEHFMVRVRESLNYFFEKLNINCRVYGHEQVLKEKVENKTK